MEALNISYKLLENLDDLKLENSQFSGEGYVILNPQDFNSVLKIFYNQDDVYFSNKLYTINSLLHVKKFLDLPQVVFPDRLLVIDDIVSGYSMPLIKGVTLADLLNNSSVDIELKVKYLQQIGDILRKMEQIRKENPNIDFYLNDLHERNLIVDEETQSLRVIDMDSCRILENKPFLAKYLSSFTPLSEFKKYNSDISLSCGGEFIADSNTELYCYTMIVLEFLYGGRVHFMSVQDYFRYLEYLKDIGANQELLDAWSGIYSNDDNVNFDYLLDDLPHFYQNANRSIYLKRTKSK